MRKDIKKIVVACDKYKGSLSSIEVCSIIKDSIIRLSPDKEIFICPMADGGDGTVEALVESLKGRYIYLKVLGPLGREVKARFGILPDMTAVIEMASASGLWLLPKDLQDPSETTTYGTGQMIKKAYELGCKKIIIGIGGSATNDAGMGMAQALGIKFYDNSGEELGYGGKNLIKIDSIDTSGSIASSYAETEVIIASDVDNLLYGKRGAAYVYAPQKGADDDMVKILDKGLRNFADIVKKDMGIKIDKIKGAGAAGGLGAGLMVFLNGRILPGADIVIDLTGIEKTIKNSDLIVTGEGKLDEQTLYGKSPYAIAKIAKRHGKPVITINGSIDIIRDPDINNRFEKYFDANFSVMKKPMTVDEAINEASPLLASATTEIFKLILL